MVKQSGGYFSRRFGGRARALEGVELNGSWLDRLTLVTTAVGAQILVTQAEAAILLAHGGMTPRDFVDRAKTNLQRVNGSVIGVVLSHVDFDAVGYDYYFGYRRRY